jgi:hypothetical protein
MTVLSGIRVPPVLSKTTSVRLSSELSELTVDYWQTPRFSDHPTHTFAMRPFTNAFVWTPPYNLPVDAGLEAKAGSTKVTYKHDLYFRVHVKPALIDFGNLINTEVRDVVVWNATFAFQFLSQTTSPTQPGVTFALPDGLALPYILKPLEEVITKVEANISGPPSIDSEFTFTISGFVYRVRSIGRRILLWPFPPNWRTQVDDSYVFKSWALRSSNGKVQSGSQWGNAPRRELEYNVLLKRDDSARAENLLMGWQSRFYGVVCWPDRSNLTADVPAGTRVIIPCDTTNRSFAAGGFVVIFDRSTRYESAEIESVTPTSITVTSDLKNTWESGLRVFPVFAGLINATVSGVRHTDGVIELPVSFECEPSTTYGNTPVGPAVPTYRGEELYLGRLNWVSPLAFEYNSDREKIDLNTGRFYSDSESDWTPQNKEHTWFLKSREDAQAFRQFLGRREGIARPVYMPTGNTDLTLIADPLIGSVVIDVIDVEYTVLAAHPARRDIIMLMKNGTYFTRRVLEAGPIPGGEGTRIVLDQAWAATIDRNTVKRISFLGLYRLVSNKATIRWHTDDKGTVNLRLITDRND